MDGMSEREYSSHSGLSRGAIQKARKAGRLVVYGDGSINAAGSDARRSEMTDPDQQRRSTGGDTGFSGPADSSSYLKARTALTVYQAQERQLAIQKKKGTLVDRAHADRKKTTTSPIRVNRYESLSCLPQNRQPLNQICSTVRYLAIRSALILGKTGFHWATAVQL